MHPSLRNVNAFHPICILNVNFQDLFYQKAIFYVHYFTFSSLFKKEVTRQVFVFILKGQILKKAKLSTSNSKSSKR